MPYPRHHTWQIWEECPRCGLDYPKSMLKKEYTGARVCPDCYDPKGYEENLTHVLRKMEEFNVDEQENNVL